MTKVSYKVGDFYWVKRKENDNWEPHRFDEDGDLDGINDYIDPDKAHAIGPKIEPPADG